MILKMGARNVVVFPEFCRVVPDDLYYSVNLFRNNIFLQYGLKLIKVFFFNFGQVRQQTYRTVRCVLCLILLLHLLFWLSLWQGLIDMEFSALLKFYT